MYHIIKIALNGLTINKLNLFTKWPCGKYINFIHKFKMEFGTL